MNCVDFTGSLKETKKACRKKMRQLLSENAGNSDFDCVEKSIDACTYFLESELYRNAPFVFCFLSFEQETQTDSIINRCLSDGKTVAVPRCIPGTNKMEFYILEDKPLSLQTESGSFGIREPLESLEKLDLSNVPDGSVMILSGLAFTESGKRLGRGKGFYDRYISMIKDAGISCIYAGLCYGFQILEYLPSGVDDALMDFIIVESGIIKCN